MPYQGSLYQEFRKEYLKRCLKKGPYIKNLLKNIWKVAWLKVFILSIYRRIFKKVRYYGTLYQVFAQEYLKGCLVKGPYKKNLDKNI